MLSKFKRNKHQQHLAQLPKISQSVDDVDFFYTPATFRETLLEKIASATQRICIVALYLEQDDGGKGILDALYAAKRQRPELDVRVLVDWHRAQRGRIGAAASNTNADWYCRLAQENPGIDVPVYGVPINTREALGVRRFLSRLQYYVNTDQLVVRLWKDDDNTYHLKGMWVDDKWMLLTGNNLNPRAWRLDLENAILIHDPKQELAPQREKELELIRTHTTIVKHYRDLQSIADYPIKVRKLIRRLRRIRIDRLISRIL